jgi:DNA processing protein
VPGSPLDPRCRGTNDLIRRGATLTESADDVIEVLQSQLRSPVSERRKPTFAVAPAPAPSDEELAAARLEVVERLSPTPVTVDEIIRQCQLSPATVFDTPAIRFPSRKRAESRVAPGKLWTRNLRLRGGSGGGHRA